MNNKQVPALLFFIFSLILAAGFVMVRRGQRKSSPTSSEMAKTFVENDWETFEDEYLKFKYPPDFKIKIFTEKPKKLWVAYSKVEIVAGALQLRGDEDEKRSLRKIYDHSQEVAFHGEASRPRKLRSERNDCLIYQTRIAYYGTCYSDSLQYFEASSGRNYLDNLGDPKDPLIAKNFERFLRSMEYK